MKNKGLRVTLIVVISVLALILIGVGVSLFIGQQQTIRDMEQQFDIQKTDLENEYEQLAIQYDGFNEINLRNDSIIDQLSKEKVKVTRLLEELRTLNKSNVLRIGELQKELSTLREIMRGFVMQIDSLNRLNAELTRENTEVKRQYQEVTSQAGKLAQEKEKLQEKVEQASLLDAININVQGLNKRSKETSSIRSLETIRIDFAIAKNITAKVGERFVYVQIYKPDGGVLAKNQSDLFKFENKSIPYSCRKMVVYDGEQQEVTLYWKVEEFLNPGNYRVDVFVDGNHVGQKAFVFNK